MSWRREAHFQSRNLISSKTLIIVVTEKKILTPEPQALVFNFMRLRQITGKQTTPVWNPTEDRPLSASMSSSFTHCSKGRSQPFFLMEPHWFLSFFNGLVHMPHPSFVHWQRVWNLLIIFLGSVLGRLIFNTPVQPCLSGSNLNVLFWMGLSVAATPWMYSPCLELHRVLYGISPCRANGFIVLIFFCGFVVHKPPHEPGPLLNRHLIRQDEPFSNGRSPQLTGACLPASL